jgi:hypothetical protein
MCQGRVTFSTCIFGGVVMHNVTHFLKYFAYSQCSQQSSKNLEGIRSAANDASCADLHVCKQLFVAIVRVCLFLTDADEELLRGQSACQLGFERRLMLQTKQPLRYDIITRTPQTREAAAHLRYTSHTSLREHLKELFTRPRFDGL